MSIYRVHRHILLVHSHTHTHTHTLRWDAMGWAVLCIAMRYCVISMYRAKKWRKMKITTR